MKINQRNVALILWINWVIFLPIYMNAIVLVIVVPVGYTLMLGLPLLIFAPPLGLMILLNSAFYGWIFYLAAQLFSYLICYSKSKTFRLILLGIILLSSFSITFIPIYGQGSAWRSGSFEGTSFWKAIPKNLQK